MTTAKSITDGQIRALRNEAGQAGDLEMVAAAIKGLRKPAARARCAEVIAEAQGRS